MKKFYTVESAENLNLLHCLLLDMLRNSNASDHWNRKEYMKKSMQPCENEFVTGQF